MQKRPFSRTKPAKMLKGSPATTSLRVCPESADALDRIRCQIQEWLLSHSLKEYRAYGLVLTVDQALRIVLATFARDFSISLCTEVQDE